MRKSLKILVAGGHGFVGGNLIEELKKKNKNLDIFPLSRMDGFDLMDYESTRIYIKKISPHVIYNLAAHVGSVHYSIKHQAQIMHDNTIMTLNLYKSAQEVSPDAKIINPLSNCSYPGDADIQKEEAWWNGEVHDSVFASGNSRKMLYVISKCYQLQFGIKTVNFLIPNLFGPGDYTDPNKTHALNGMIIRMIKAHKNHNKTFEIWGTGRPIREWGYVKDIAKIFVMSINLEKDLTYPVNIGQKKGYSIKESAHIIAKVIGYGGKIIFNTKYQDGAYKKVLDDRKFRQVFPNFRFTKHEHGIRETVKYYQNVLA